MKCEKCGSQMDNVYLIEYKLTNTNHDFFVCQNVECNHTIKNVSYIQEVTGKEKEHVLEARAGMII